jgi:ribosomal-protein-alanine N-acetyltransferase
MNNNLNSFPNLETENLTLRPLSIEDDNEIYTLRSDLNAAQYLDRPITETIDDARDFIRKIINGNNNAGIYWAITQKNKTKLAGTICLWNFSADKTKAEIGFELLPACQGKGIMQEAITVVLKYGFDFLQFNSIEAGVAAGNSKSIRILEKNGFKYTGTSLDSDTEGLKMLVYELKKDRTRHI